MAASAAPTPATIAAPSPAVTAPNAMASVVTVPTMVPVNESAACGVPVVAPGELMSPATDCTEPATV
jgi:hypothetical protein